MVDLYPSITLEQNDSGVCTISLNRPEVHNAFDETMIQSLTNALESLAESGKVRVLILSGAGKSFCAGADLNWMRRSSRFTKEDNYKDAYCLSKMLNLLYNFPHPTVALVHGSVFGGGVGLTASCDIAIAAKSTVFSLSEVKLGLIPSVISPYVIRAIGPRMAQRYFLTGERFSAKTAKSIGLVHDTCKDGSLPATRQSVEKLLLAGGPQAQSKAKELVQLIQNTPLESDLLQITAQRIADIRATTEAREGIEAFLEKKPPAWLIRNDV